MLDETEVEGQELTFTCISDVVTSRKVVTGIRALIDSRIDDPRTPGINISNFSPMSDMTLDRDAMYSYEITCTFKATKRQALSLFTALITQLLGLGSDIEIKSFKLKEKVGDGAAPLATELEAGQSGGKYLFKVETNYYYCINPKTDVRKLCHSRDIPKQPYITECIVTDKETGHQGIGLSVCSFKENTPIKSEGRKHATRRAFEAFKVKVNIEPVSSSTAKLIMPVLRACKYPGTVTYMGQYKPKNFFDLPETLSPGKVIACEAPWSSSPEMWPARHIDFVKKHGTI